MGLNQQQLSINDVKNRDHNIIVPASAGTGKTTTLTARIINYIKEGKDIDNYLIVSFTEAAASELKERITKELKDNLSEVDVNKATHYQNQIAKLPNAHISTIHSFCLDVIKKYGYVLNIDPATVGKLGNEGVLNQLRDVAMNKALDFKKNNKLIFLLNDRSEDTSAIKKIIYDLDSFIINLKDYDNWKDKVIDNYELLKKKDTSKYPIDIKKHLNQKVDELEKAFNIIIEILIRYVSETNQKKLDNLNFSKTDFAETVKKARQYINENKLRELGELFYNIDYNLSAQGISIKDEEEKEIRKYNKEKIYDKRISELQNYYYFYETTDNTFEHIKTLIEITENYHKYYDELKKEKEIIDYQDMLSMADEILSYAGGQVAKIYRNKFTEILVDEYQDTNEFQEKIINNIARANNVFRVGDVKQSIYKFQNAKPSLMKSLINKEDSNNKVLPLQYNYRSGRTIREFANYLFSKLMSINGQSYDSKIDDLLIDPEFKDRDGERIQLITLPYEKTIEDKTKSLNGKYRATYICEYIANEICRLKKEKNNKWSDFVVLVRTNSYKASIKKILNNHNISVYTKARSGFFNDEAVSNVVAILNLSLNNNKQNAFNVLTGPMFNVSYDDIASDPEVLDLDKNKEPLYSFIKELREYKENHSLVETLNYIYNYNNFYMEKINSFQRSNLDSLFQIVLDYEKEDSNIKNLVSYLSSFRTVDREEANSFNNKDDVVQIMTIHQSKGLEFKYVFLADLFFRYNESKYDHQIQFNEEFGVALKYTSLPYKVKYPSPYYDLIKKQNQKEDFEEELRVLYVAITRASQGLYVVNAAKQENLGLQTEDLYNKSMMTWIDTGLNNCPENTLDLFDRKFISEEELIDSYQKADKDISVDYINEKYKDEIILEEEKVLSPSQLESHYINLLSFGAKGNTNRGTLMHKAIELLGIKEITKKDIINLDLNLDDIDIDKILTFYENGFTKSLYTFDNYHERTFIYKNENDDLENGLIDLLSVGEDKIYIIDFKSDKNTTKEKLIKQYQYQQNAYYRVVDSYYKDKDIKMYLYSFDLNEFIEVPLL